MRSEIGSAELRAAAKAMRVMRRGNEKKRGKKEKTEKEKKEKKKRKKNKQTEKEEERERCWEREAERITRGFRGGGERRSVIVTE